MPVTSRQPGASAPSIAGSTGPAAFEPFYARVAPSPSSAIGLTREGLALFAVGDFLKAEQAFRVIVEIAPDQPLAWNNLSLVLVSLERLDEAASALRRSLALDSRQLATCNSLASVLLQLGRPGEAEQACAAALALDPVCVEAWQTRAFARAQAEDFVGAAEAFLRLLDLTGENPALCLNLGVMLMKCGRFDAAAATLARSLALDPVSETIADLKRTCDLIVAAIAGDMAEAVGEVSADQTFKTALLLLTAADRPEAAVRIAEAWANASPDNIEARHLRDAALSRAVDRQPAELVALHFDGIAEDFDDRLVRRLGYEGPERLLSLISAEVAAAGVLDVLDLGCGTGLCAPLLRPFARRLAGIDLSSRMLEKARALGLYDSLEVADLLGALGLSDGAWDLLIAADTFPYLGDLEPVFAGAVMSLRNGGWFAFSTESAESDGFVLKANGRYAQGRDYIERLADGRFTIQGHIAAPIRREAGQAVMGEFFLLRRA